MIVSDKIREQLGTWCQSFTLIIQSPEWDKIFSELKRLSGEKKTIIPKSADVFKVFALLPMDKVRAVIILMDPYPSMKDDVMVASGIPLSCENTGVLQPSLEAFWDGIEDSYFKGFNPNFDRRADISYLVKEEGVLLLNSSLTTELNKPGIHFPIWEPVMKQFIELIVNKEFDQLPIVLMGQQAQRLEKYIQPMRHHILKVEHPAVASHSGKRWNHGDCFRWCNGIIRSTDSSKGEICWYRMEGKRPSEFLTDDMTDTSRRENAMKGDLPWMNMEDVPF